MKNIYKIGIAAAVIGIAGFSFLGKKDSSNTLRIGTEGLYAPWNSTNAAGDVIGFEIDLANKVCEKINKKCVFVKQDWDGIIPALLNKKYDIIMAGMTITDERMKTVDFTVPYADTGVTFSSVKLPVRKTVQSLEKSLKGKRIGAQVGTIAALYIQKAYGDTGFAQVKIYKTQEELNLDLLAGRVDSGVADTSIWIELQKKNPKIKIISPVFNASVSSDFGKGVGAAVIKNRPELVAQINKALQELKAEGVSGKLAIKWFGFDASL